MAPICYAHLFKFLTVDGRLPIVPPSTKWRAEVCKIQMWYVNCTICLFIYIHYELTFVFQWTLTSDYYSYDRAASSCPDKYKFEAPRTAQQNHMLFMIVRNATRTVSTAKIQSTADQFVWIDLNNAGGQDCWVVGKNSTCWWASGVSSMDTERERGGGRVND